MPKFDVTSKAKPSLYAYPAPLTVPTKEAIKTVETAVLSTTAKANARAAEKKKVELAEEEKEKSAAMDTVSVSSFLFVLAWHHVVVVLFFNFF